MRRLATKRFGESRLLPFTVLVVSLLLYPVNARSEGPPTKSSPLNIAPRITKTAFESNYGKLALAFEPNRGQADSHVKYLARGPGYTLALSPTQASLVLTHMTAPVFSDEGVDLIETPASQLEMPKTESHAITLTMLGANRAPRIEGIEKLLGISNYFLGNDRSRWRSDIPNYSKVRYSSVYPGVDLVYYGTQGHLEYDFVVAPHANPGAIRFALDGADKVELSPFGDLVMHAGRDQLSLRKPLIFQEIAGHRREIAGHLKQIDKRTFGFEIVHYDRGSPLIIDPGLV